MVCFYRDILRFSLVYFEKDVCAFFTIGDRHSPKFALYAGRKHLLTDGDAHWFLAVDVEDIEAAREELIGLGLAVGAIKSVPHGKALKFADPEGNILELHQPQSKNSAEKQNQRR